jgi:hypothetical protein
MLVKRLAGSSTFIVGRNPFELTKIHNLVA